MPHSYITFHHPDGLLMGLCNLAPYVYTTLIVGLGVFILHNLPPITTHDIVGFDHVADHELPRNNALFKKIYSHFVDIVW